MRSEHDLKRLARLEEDEMSEQQKEEQTRIYEHLQDGACTTRAKVQVRQHVEPDGRGGGERDHPQQVLSCKAEIEEHTSEVKQHEDEAEGSQDSAENDETLARALAVANQQKGGMSSSVVSTGTT